MLDPARAAAAARSFLSSTGDSGQVRVSGDTVFVTVTIAQPTQILGLAGLLCCGIGAALAYLHNSLDRLTGPDFVSVWGYIREVLLEGTDDRQAFSAVSLMVGMLAPYVLGVQGVAWTWNVAVGAAATCAVGMAASVAVPARAADA